MKILIVTHSTKFSGANKSLYSLILLFNKIGYDITVIVNSEKGELVSRLNKIGIRVLFYNYSWWVSQDRTNKMKKIYQFIHSISKYYFYRMKYNKISEDIIGENFDLVYTNTSTIDLGVYVAKKMHIPHFWHIREFGKEDFNFTYLVTRKYREKAFEYSRLICISNALKKKFEKIFPNKEIDVVYNGFEITNFTKQDHSIDINRNVNICICGQVSIAKGQHLLIDAVSRLISKGYHINLFLIGDVDYTYLKKYCEGFEQFPWLKIMGYINNVTNFRKKMDIEVVCSRSEAFGRVLLEAMLIGLPTIGTSKGAIGELIEDNENGLIFNEDNYFELEKRIEDLISDPLLYSKISKNAHTFSKQFTIEKTFNNIKAIFEQNI
ncbi:glycosyltransferase family 4 protein [Enterococcus casseliflavus]|uniref:glycosyltransferase family 4 protein n=1 Tax=Enterococcus casseliflavus TaxID=37734 RepID=UPI00129C84CF|nr:glycosyltransferase family 4 protein [Enterococcus casseliflavus]MRI69878.1 glycosyltransferase family 4 protein [Enterococcus casseliflavus]